MAYIFTQGTCLKKEIYDLIVNSLVGVGWVNISSNVADGDVLTSTGVSGTRSLVMQLFPYDAGGFGASAANYNNTTYNLRTSTTYNTMGIRLPMLYTPGAAGAAGTIKRPSQTIKRINVVNCNVAVDPNCKVNYSLYVDKNRIIIATKTPDMLAIYGQLIHIGVPDTQYVKATDARNMVLCSTAGNITANSANSSDYPDVSMGSYGDWYPLVWNTLTPPRMPNVNNSFFLAEPYYQSDDVGLVGKIDGVYMLPSTYCYLNHGDIITVGTSKFKTLLIANNVTGFACAWPSTMALIQIA